MTNRDLLVDLLIDIMGKPKAEIVNLVDGVASENPKFFGDDFQMEIMADEAEHRLNDMRNSNFFQMMKDTYATAKRLHTTPDVKVTTPDDVKHIFD